MKIKQANTSKDQTKDQGKDQGKNLSKDQGKDQTKDQGKKRSIDQGKNQGKNLSKDQTKDQSKIMGKEDGKRSEEIDVLLAAILGNCASEKQIQEFAEWIKCYENESYFERFKDMWHVSVDEHYRKSIIRYNNPGRFITYIHYAKRRERSRRALRFTASAAALFLIFFSISYIFLGIGGDKDFSKLKYASLPVKVEVDNGKYTKSIKGISMAITNVDAAIGGVGGGYTVDGGYTGDGGSVVDGVYTTVDSTGNVKGYSLQSSSVDGSANSGNARSKDIRKTTYNSVSTPAGERAAMVLPDNTKVYLTANSYLRYPTRFEGGKREVTLVGRGYFEVTKSKVPFIVKTSDMDIEVLGTSFDVESREKSDKASVILVEGSVKVHAGEQTQIIRPDEQMSLNRETRLMSVHNVDSKLLTMWKDGVLVVHAQTFKELIESLVSWYGVEIIDRTHVSKDERFNGRFDREDIEAAIKAISISANVSYRIEEGKLILESR